MTFNNWTDLSTKCPISLDRIKKYYFDFNSYLPSNMGGNLTKVKENLFNARGSFDSMIITLVQNLYDINILKTKEDKILYSWLIENLANFKNKLDEEEEHLIIKFDEPDPERSMVGTSRLSAYAKLLKTSADNIIYESLRKATEEYVSLKETKIIKKEPRTFLYILFQILNVTIFVIAGSLRKQSISNKKGMMNSMPLGWQGLMTDKGSGMIKSAYQEDSGNNLDDYSDDMDTLQEGEEEITKELEEDDD